jgi:hypothetical protein
MARNTVTDKARLQLEILTYLSRHGASSSQLLCQLLKISQPTLSRILSSMHNELLVIGKARDTKYAAHRKITDTTTPIPIYEILEDTSSHLLGILHPLKPHDFYFEARAPEAKSAIYNDIPYFLNDLRPSGFLGRMIPRQNEDLHLPQNIHLWTADNSLKYLCNRAWNSIGNLILGEKSFQIYLEKSQTTQNGVEKQKRNRQYALYANDVLAMGDPGSSAGGEQPKFTTILLPEKKHVIVKFSPPVHSEIGQRVADILICEYLALQTLKKYACDTADSEILMYDDRIFLEVERFDRIGKFGRRGVISLGTLDAEFAGTISTWSKTAAELVKRKIISEALLEKIRFRETFGEFIANNDMHLYNLSFFTQGQIVMDLAPVYDMSPMLFMPQNNQILEKQFKPPLPLPENAKTWILAYAAACEFWDAVLKNKQISPAFKKIAAHCKSKVTELRDLAQLLPKNAEREPPVSG